MTDVQTTSIATQLQLRKVLNAPRERVFAAWTTPDQLVQFLGPEEFCRHADVDFRVGGRYRLTMRGEDGTDWYAGGVYREIVAPERLVMTWAWEEDDPALEQETVLSLEFHARGAAQTELILTHTNFRDAEQRARHEGGWTMILDALDARLSAAVATVRIRGIDLSGYMVKDAARAIAFYRDVLGLEPARVYPERRGAEYDLPDGTTFGLWGGGGKVMPFQPSNGILFAVDDLDEALAAVAARGVPVAMRTQTPGCRMAAIADTEGNLVFLHQRTPV